MKRRHLRRCLALLLLLVLTFSALVHHARSEAQAHFTPAYEKLDLSVYYDRETLSEEDYACLFRQTGLGKPAVDYLFASGQQKQLADYQQDFFAPVRVMCYNEVIVTSMDLVCDEEKQPVSAFRICLTRPGYVLVTGATHTLGWRHGHCGIITDGISAAEAQMIGVPSKEDRLSSWRSMPSFLLLRLKDVPDETMAKISAYVKDEMLGVPYDLTAGIFGDKADFSKTQCAHFVWYAFFRAGYDLDSDGGRIVTVGDLVRSDLLEVVQIYGLDPDAIWRW